MAERRIWPTNNLVDLKQVADAFGLPGTLEESITAPQSVEEILNAILLEVTRIRIGIAALIDTNLESITTDDL